MNFLTQEQFLFIDEKQFVCVIAWGIISEINTKLLWAKMKQMRPFNEAECVCAIS